MFKQGGFDIVIGNPPYGTSFIEAVKKYFWAKFKNQNYQLESYMLFLEQAFVLLLKEGGKYGMIFPNPWLTNLRQRNLRKFIFEKATVNEIIHFKQPVFPQTTVDTEIVLLTNIRVKNNIVKITIVEKGSSLRQDKHEIITHNQEEWIAAKGDVINIFQTTKEKKLSKKILKDTTKLEEYFTIHVGIKPYQAGKGKPKQTKSDVTNRVFDSDRKKNNLYRAYLRGVDINRYSTLPLKERYIKFGLWLAEPRPVVNFDADVKIFMRQTGDSLIGTIDTKQYLCLNNMHVLVPKATTKCDAKYFLGIINSRLLNWYYQSINPEKGEALAEVKKANIAILPIKIANVKVQHEIIRLVDQLLKLNEEKSKTKLQTEISQIETKINYCEDKINSLIYELYGLTDKEIKIVENS
ncbi:MAG: Eco57I restriction-modification methylase domain-containing protein [Planctomycetaceae bacterium]|nr:Eco57I restriction-modification methylase domain-containing protein [Planctomycetaceae bacterium]